MEKVSQQGLDKMKHLIDFGSSDNIAVVNNKPIVEFHQKGADGRTYGIIRENNKFYIKVAPAKDTEIVAEDYDYIGGITNRKTYEYPSYALASKQFDLKMMSINEAYDSSHKSTVCPPLILDSEWQIPQTREMREAIDRIKEIADNANKILSGEDISYTAAHTLPEAPNKKEVTKEVASPFVDTAVAKGEEDFENNDNDYRNAGKPFFTKKEKLDREAAMSNKGSKNIDIKGKTIKLTEEQAVECGMKEAYYYGEDEDWGKEEDTTESSYPYDDEEEMFTSSMRNYNKQRKRDAKYERSLHNKKMRKANMEEAYYYDPNDEFYGEDYDDEEEDYDRLLKDVEELPIKVGYIDSRHDEDFYEKKLKSAKKGKDTKQEMGEGIVLNDFGKHPRYRKPFMTTPSSKETSKTGREWDDISTRSSKPYGEKIGSSSPYDEKVIDIITDAIMDEMYPRKKKS